MTGNVIRCRDKELAWHNTTIIMGVLNITPDSFSDGGRFLLPEEAKRQAVSMARDGAKIIDIGGESSRPFSEPVPVEEELNRVIPVIKAIRPVLNCLISIDTTKAKVAMKAIEAGADMINDISGLRMDDRMASVVRDRRVPIVVMHMQGTPRDMQKSPFYHDVVGEIDEFFAERISFCMDQGIPRQNIILDPGIGFGKRFQDNLDIINGMSKFTRHGLPVLAGPSRKAFLGEITGKKIPSERDSATVGAAVACALNGASMIRVHNVAATSDALRVIDALRQRKNETESGLEKYN